MTITFFSDKKQGFETRFDPAGLTGRTGSGLKNESKLTGFVTMRNPVRPAGFLETRVDPGQQFRPGVFVSIFKLLKK